MDFSVEESRVPHVLKAPWCHRLFSCGCLCRAIQDTGSWATLEMRKSDKTQRSPQEGSKYLTIEHRANYPIICILIEFNEIEQYF